MSTGHVGIVGSVVAGQLQQSRNADSDRTAHDVANQSRRADSNEQASKASGIGEMQREGETSERDADGRRLWEGTDHRKGSASPDAKPDPKSKDPSGDAGNQLDLSG